MPCISAGHYYFNSKGICISVRYFAGLLSFHAPLCTIWRIGLDIRYSLFFCSHSAKAIYAPLIFEKSPYTIVQAITGTGSIVRKQNGAISLHKRLDVQVYRTSVLPRWYSPPSNLLSRWVKRLPAVQKRPSVQGTRLSFRPS